MLELLREDLKWLQNSLKMEDFKTFAILTFCHRAKLFDFLELERSIEEVAKNFEMDFTATKALLYFLKSKGLVEGEERFKISNICRILFKSKLSIGEILEEKFREVENWLNFEKAIKGLKRREEEFFRNRIIYLGKFALLGDIKVVNLVSELEEFKNAKKLLDLAGGHGLYAYAFTLLNKNLKAIVFDLPEVVEVARNFLKDLGAERVEFVSGDLFKDPIGEDFDLIFSSFNPGGKKAELIPKIYNALKPGGIYVNRQYFPKEGFDVRDLEWNLWRFEKLEKDFKSFTFKGDLSLEDYIYELEKNGFKILRMVEEDYVVLIAKREKDL
uniref:Methyltransferase domain-containing protein n=1 Tax=Archaeoglobus fulgidus TaxID=2234 RepID=A0A7J2TIG7_ARCFL